MLIPSGLPCGPGDNDPLQLHTGSSSSSPLSDGLHGGGGIIFEYVDEANGPPVGGGVGLALAGCGLGWSLWLLLYHYFSTFMTSCNLVNIVCRSTNITYLRYCSFSLPSNIRCMHDPVGQSTQPPSFECKYYISKYYISSVVVYLQWLHTFSCTT